MDKIQKIVFLLLLVTIYSCASEENTGDNAIKIIDGFKIEKLFTSNDSTFGSWVSITAGEEGKLIVSDQYGKIYQFKPPAQGEVLKEDDLEPLYADFGSAQGLLLTEKGLLVTVNEESQNAKYPSGIYLLEREGDNKYAAPKLLFSLKGNGEHGPHSLVEGPDGFIYFVSGNATAIPDSSRFIVPDIWDEDNLLPVITDPSGIFKGWKAPGGWIGRFSLTDSVMNILATGFRNAYDIAFDENGELFTFDSDMEWDIGTPWYRPVRVCHVIPGAEFGWRTGSGKWPSYYPDNLDGILDIGQGSPTGVLSASTTNFPYPFNQGLFILDWSFGTMYHVQLTPSGSSYSAKSTEFISGKPLPFTDLTTLNGDMYFVTGGRRLESGLYRVTSTGKKEETPAQNAFAEAEKARAKRKYIEKTQNLDSIWRYLGHPDRFLRFTARTSLEKLQDRSWVERIETEDKADIRIQALIALCRMGLPVDDAALTDWYLQTSVENMNERQRLDFLRAIQLYHIRMGGYNEDNRAWAEKVYRIEANGNHDIIREKFRILAFLGDDRVIGEGLAYLDGVGEEEGRIISEEVLERSSQYGEILAIIRRNNPETRRLGILEILSVVDTGWTPKLREQYFHLFNDVFHSAGGYSYKGYARAIAERALSKVDSLSREEYRAASGIDASLLDAGAMGDLPQPEGPGRNWRVSDISALSAKAKTGDVSNGKKMYEAALCARCHVMGNTGNPVGPGLTTLSGRFSTEEILLAIIEPSRAISDQYAMKEIILKDGRNYTGLLKGESENELQVSINIFDPENTIKLDKNEILEIKTSLKSPMPAGLLNRLNEKEIADLLNYLLTGQNN